MSPTPAPLSNAAFRAVWLASVFSFIGTWVQDVGESWVMLSMSRDPRLVALLSTCFFLAPTLALTLPAGLLADRVDRRRLLLWSEAACVLAAAGPAVAIRAHAMTPFVLLACTAMLGAAVAIGAPAWITLVPELLPRRQTAEAVTLGSIAFNIARIVGPALGGVLLAASGAETTFIVNAISFTAVFWVLFRFDAVKRASELARPSTPHHLAGALADPFRVVWRSPQLRGAFGSAAAFAAAASIVMGILPAFAKHALGATATGYGALLSALGCGAIVSGLSLAGTRARLGIRATVAGGIALYGASMLFAARAPTVAMALPFFFVAGLGWIACLSTLSARVQLTATTESKSGVVALYQLSFYTAATLGVFVGGSVAERFTERAAVTLGAITSLGAATLAARALSATRLTLPEPSAGPPANPGPARARGQLDAS